MKGIPDYRFSSNCSTVTVALPSAAKVMPSADSDPEDQRFESSRSHQEQYLMGAALFVLHGFYGAVKERIRTARAPRFASRGAETPRWGVSRAWLGESLRAHLKIALQCTLRSKAVIVGLIFNTRQKTISVSHIVMFAEKTYNAFELVGHTKRGKERES